MKSIAHSILLGILVGIFLQGSLILGFFILTLCSQYFTPPPISTYLNIYHPPVHSLEMMVTSYTNRVQETNEDPGNTATMERPVVGGTCAVSRDLMHWLGGRVYIEGIGVRRVNDLMHSRFEQSLDLFMGTVEEAREFGKQRKMVVYLGK